MLLNIFCIVVFCIVVFCITSVIWVLCKEKTLPSDYNSGVDGGSGYSNSGWSYNLNNSITEPLDECPSYYLEPLDEAKDK